MTKADLVEEVARMTELTRKDSEVIVDTLFESVIEALKAGDKLEVRGFGSFRVRQRNARVGRNPKTGEKVEVSAKKGALLQAEQGIERLDQSQERCTQRACRTRTTKHVVHGYSLGVRGGTITYHPPRNPEPVSSASIPLRRKRLCRTPYGTKNS